MKKIFLTTLAALVSSTCLLSVGYAQTAAAAILVEFQGPGGHSSSNYGRTSALHAAARSIVKLQEAGLPMGSYSIAELTGGNSVNSIASDGKFIVKLNPQSGISPEDLLSKVNEAAKAGTDAENAFRNVKPGDLTAGAAADIRYSVQMQ
ncbi:peptidase M20 [Lampropedia puyangensis]|uniref:Peptidase M20 n=1 Tax=Lampropedia puyangensis TaxID=1330072 RepID=A0A4S8EZ58_9BURK|nr:peptidase dimerization domain-containing protein [Lampropedia puyangensis]THU00223.1 peptidase M20 [Lampropedia puyangensis]